MFFEDFKVDGSVRTPERRITGRDLDAFIQVSGLYLPMFMDDEAAAKVGHKRRLVPGPMILSVAMGLVRETGWFDHIVAVAAFDELRFVRPVHPEDAVSALIRVVQTKATRNPSRGLVALAYSVTNQNRETVFSAVGKYLMQTRQPSSGAT